MMKEAKDLFFAVLCASIIISYVDAHQTGEKIASVNKVKQKHEADKKLEAELKDKSEYMTGVKAK